MPPAYWNTSVRGSGAASLTAAPGFARSSCSTIFRPLFRKAISRKRLGQGVVVEDGGLGEYFRIRPERGLRARVLGSAHPLQLLAGLAVVECDLVFRAVAAHVHLDARGERVHHRHAHAVQATGHLVSFAAELAAGVQDGQNDLDRGDLLFRMLVHRDAAAIVGDGDGVVGMDPYLDLVAIAGKRLVDGVVHHLVHQVVQAARPGRADVHAGALAHRFQPFEYLDVRTIVMVGFVSH